MQWFVNTVVLCFVNCKYGFILIPSSDKVHFSLRLMFLFVAYCSDENKDSVKIPKEYSESVNRRTDNTMATRKRTKGHWLINTTQKNKD